MTNLTKNLRHLLSFHGVHKDHQDQAIEEIMKALEGAGYNRAGVYYFNTDGEGKLTLHTNAELSLTEAIKETAETIQHYHPSGSEWLNTFTTELNAIPGITSTTRDVALRCAKKASGVE